MRSKNNKISFFSLTLVCAVLIITLLAACSSGGGTDTGNNQALQLTSASSVSILENSTYTGYVATANNPGGGALSFSIVGGDDQVFFFIDSNSGVLSFIFAPDFENPLDSDTNNTYIVVLSVSDGLDSSSLTLTITVTDDTNESGNTGPGGTSGPTSIEIYQTGQIDCYDGSGSMISCTGTGQDGETLSGAFWPIPRFTDNGDNTVTDNLTGLIWPSDGNVMPTRDVGWDTDGTTDDGAVTWQHALDYVAKLNNESYLGRTDWRLPNRNELRTLAHYGVSNNGTELNAVGMLNYGRSYWSSTSNILVPTQAWAMNMVSGYVFLNEKPDTLVAFLHVVPVADSNIVVPAAMASTLQSSCYNEAGVDITCAGTGQDGEYQNGVSRTIRFTNNSDGTMTDEVTKLMWTIDANLMVVRDPGWDTDGASNDGAVTFQHALDYIAKLNAESYLGYTDWRLSNIVELQSLTQQGTTNSTWLSNNGFINVPIASNYWSSDNFIAIPSTAWVVQLSSPTLNGGSSPATAKTGNYYVWPVRN